MIETSSSSSSSSSPSSSSSRFPIGISPSDLSLGMEIDVESRTWPGINKAGGHGTISKIHLDSNDVPNMVDVKYVLGGTEKNVELMYVKMHVELSRGGRGRRRDVKMNLEAMGGGTETKKKRKKKKKGGNKKGADSNNDKKKAARSSSPMKKRKALGNIDGNKGRPAKTPKKKGAVKADDDDDGGGGSSKSDESSRSSPPKGASEAGAEAGGTSENAAIEAAEGGKDDDGEWTLVKDGDAVDYQSSLRRGARVSYYWCEEDGWLPGTVFEPLKEVAKSAGRRWTIGVDFDDGGRFVMPFCPTTRWWRVERRRMSNEREANKPANKPTNKPVASLKSSPRKTASEKKSVSRKSTGAEAKERENTKRKPAAKKPTTPKKRRASSDPWAAVCERIRSAQQKGSPLSAAAALERFRSADEKRDRDGANRTKRAQGSTPTSGAPPKSKIREVSSKIHGAARVTPAGDALVDRIHDSMLAARAARASSPVPPASKHYARGMPSPRKKSRGVVPRAASGVSMERADPPKETSWKTAMGSAYKSEGSMESAEGPRKAPLKSVSQEIYRRECDKAEKFVKEMRGSSSEPERKEESGAAVALSLSPENHEDSEGDELEVKLDQGRVTLFNRILTEIMFRKRIDTMDVDEMMVKLNAALDSSNEALGSSEEKSFTLLEVRPYLQKLHDASRIFMVEDEGRHGVIYEV